MRRVGVRVDALGRWRGHWLAPPWCVKLVQERDDEVVPSGLQSGYARDSNERMITAVDTRDSEFCGECNGAVERAASCLTMQGRMFGKSSHKCTGL